MENAETKFLKIEKQPKPANRKTDIFFVYAKEGNSLLARIVWYAPWRKYIFEPAPNTIYETQCLTDIVEFLKKLMQEHAIQISEKKNGKWLYNNAPSS